MRKDRKLAISIYRCAARSNLAGCDLEASHDGFSSLMSRAGTSERPEESTFPGHEVPSFSVQITEPSVLPYSFFVHLSRPCAQDTRAVQVANHMVRIFAAHDRQPANIALQHSEQCVKNKFVGIRHDQLCAARVANFGPSFRIFFERSQQVSLRHNPH